MSAVGHHVKFFTCYSDLSHSLGLARKYEFYLTWPGQLSNIFIISLLDSIRAKAHPHECSLPVGKTRTAIGAGLKESYQLPLALADGSQALNSQALAQYKKMINNEKFQLRVDNQTRNL